MSERKPAKRKAPKSIASNSDDQEFDEEYRQKRIRNNEAVKKSRMKTNKTATERKERVEALKLENIQLDTRIKECEKNIETLKNLLLSTAKDIDREKIIQEIMDADDSE